MNFELVRFGWPNTAVILTLAVMPIFSLTLSADPPSQRLQVETIDMEGQRTQTTAALTLAE